MIDKGLVTFFELKACGHYPAMIKNRSDTAVAMTLIDTLEGVISWARGRPFTDTLPVDIDPCSSRHPILLKSFKHDEKTGDYLFIFWECLGDNDGKVGAVVSDSMVGDSSDDTVNIASDEHEGRKLTPGHPMYYWFIPSLNIFATINFPHSSVSTEGVASYFRDAMKHRVISDYRKVTSELDENGVDSVKQVTFRDSNNKSLKYLFNQHMMDINLGSLDLESEAKKITHIVVKEIISKNQTTERDTAFTLWGRAEKTHRSPQPVSRSVEVITETRTDGKGLKELLQLYSNERSIRSNEIDIGYRTSYETKTTNWFGRYLNRPYFIADKTKKGTRAAYTAEYLLEDLTKQRDSILQNVIYEFRDRASNN
jgi:hypothetical protein